MSSTSELSTYTNHQTSLEITLNAPLKKVRFLPKGYDELLKDKEMQFEPLFSNQIMRLNWVDTSTISSFK